MKLSPTVTLGNTFELDSTIDELMNVPTNIDIAKPIQHVTVYDYPIKRKKPNNALF